ncbi:MAG: hypothetical protein IT436_00035 [Phycisphaerales bacterium]|nr:hypothetical protein [Phycisphaerales bacterium]
MSSPSHIADLSESIAALAHDAWRRMMVADGWTPGAVYDEALRTHDGLVPFDRLSPDDRQATVEAIRFEGAERWLAGLVDYPRGPDRPLTAPEMRVGLRVIEIRKDDAGAPPTDGLQGEVIAWLNYPSGALKFVRVRWSDGMISVYSPFGGELRRA